jgi:hypothetical protein
MMQMKNMKEIQELLLRKFDYLPEKLKIRIKKSSQEDTEDSVEKDVKTKKDDSHSAEDSEDKKLIIKMCTNNGRQHLKQLLNRQRCSW